MREARIQILDVCGESTWILYAIYICEYHLCLVLHIYERTSVVAEYLEAQFIEICAYPTTLTQVNPIRFHHCQIVLYWKSEYDCKKKKKKTKN